MCRTIAASKTHQILVRASSGIALWYIATEPCLEAVVKVHHIRFVVAGLLVGVIALHGSRGKSETLTLDRVPNGPVRAARSAKVAETYGRVPLSFEANRGQTDRRVSFLSRKRVHPLPDRY